MPSLWLLTIWKPGCVVSGESSAVYPFERSHDATSPAVIPPSGRSAAAAGAAANAQAAQNNTKARLFIEAGFTKAEAFP